jgi:hypothetical protein
MSPIMKLTATPPPHLTVPHCTAPPHRQDLYGRKEWRNRFKQAAGAKQEPAPALRAQSLQGRRPPKRLHHARNKKQLAALAQQRQAERRQRGEGAAAEAPLGGASGEGWRLAVCNDLGSCASEEGAAVRPERGCFPCLGGASLGRAPSLPPLNQVPPCPRLPDCPPRSPGSRGGGAAIQVTNLMRTMYALQWFDGPPP